MTDVFNVRSQYLDLSFFKGLKKSKQVTFRSKNFVKHKGSVRGSYRFGKQKTINPHRMGGKLKKITATNLLD